MFVVKTWIPTERKDYRTGEHFTSRTFESHVNCRDMDDAIHICTAMQEVDRCSEVYYKIMLSRGSVLVSISELKHLVDNLKDMEWPKVTSFAPPFFREVDAAIPATPKKAKFSWKDDINAK